MALTFLITAGPTREYLDPVRYFSNASSGAIGYALAGAALRRGHKVMLISGPVVMAAPRGAVLKPVISAREMFDAVKKNYKKADIFIGAAAVADWRPKKTARNKIKKSGRAIKLNFIPNPDIVKFLGGVKGGKVLVGFALESSNLLPRARKKLKEKNMDMVVANYPDAIGSKQASAWIINNTNSVIRLRFQQKKLLTERIIDEALRIWKARKPCKGQY